ncbi:hypothetical protein [Bacillus amyloliquefaciens]|uniref:hypothetical protein n=1 Tax=Bacillus amyloliquefaciens TaxID=1390 RepID=UPI00280696C2|nr:hypothetical protein [Bacillus amyloliquefaciens]MDQ8094156.1 hypothetical protein [Bacillus amyloliquefaciens]
MTAFFMCGSFLMILFYQFTIFLFRNGRILPRFRLDDVLSAANGHPVSDGCGLDLLGALLF